MIEPPSARAIFDVLKEAKVEFVISLPDRTTSRLIELIQQDPSFKFVPVCKEDEGVSICSALSFANRRAVLIMQHTGLLDSVNALLGDASEFKRPLVMIVGLLNKERGLKPMESKKLAVRISEPVLDILNISHVLVDARGDEGRIAGLIEEAYSTPKPVCILIGSEVV